LIVETERRVKRQIEGVDILPVSGRVEIVLLIDYIMYLRLTYRDVKVLNETDKITNLLIYFAQMVEIVRSATLC